MSRSAAMSWCSKLPRDNATDYIKRLIGLPGDTIQMRHGILYINGVPVERDRLATPVRTPANRRPSNAIDYLEHLPGGVTHVIRKQGDDNPLDNTRYFHGAAASLFLHGRQSRQFAG